MLSRALVRLAVALILGAAAGCDRGPPEDGEAPRVRRSRGAPSGELRKDNVSKVTYPIVPPAPAGAAEPGRWYTGDLAPSDPTLDDRTHFDVWTLSGEQGDRFHVAMESADFDAFLMIAGPLEGPIDVLAEDDDSGGGTDARLEFVLPRTGTYAVIANSVFPAELGAYRIRIDRSETTVSRPDDRRTADDR